MSPAADRLIVALDTGSLAQAEGVVRALRPAVRWFKVGSELFTAAGPDAVRMVQGYEARVFLDLKWHDIPNTAAGAVRSAADLGVAMMNVHVAGGEAMLRAAVAAKASTILIGVTVLTSDAAPVDSVVEAARLGQRCRLDGVVASAREAAAIKTACGRDFVIVAPGIRPGAVAGDDQARTAGPAEAVRAGADYLVVGRPITRSADPLMMARAILEEIDRETVRMSEIPREGRTKAVGLPKSFD